MLTIDGVSLDSYLVTKSYSVNEVDEYGNSEWRDGWWRKHRDIIKKTVKGSVVLSFSSATAYNTFVTHINDSIGVEGDHSVTLYVNNLGITKTITAYVTFESQVAISTPAYGNSPVFWNITMNIEER